MSAGSHTNSLTHLHRAGHRAPSPCLLCRVVVAMPTVTGIATAAAIYLGGVVGGRRLLLLTLLLSMLLHTMLLFTMGLPLLLLL
jgi:hypothetical protein